MHCRRDQRGLVAAALREIFNAEGSEQARERVTHVLERLKDVAPKVCELLEAAEEDQAGLIRSELALFNARLDARTSARPGGTLRLAVDPGRFHFFDPQTGASLEKASAPEPVAVTR